MELTEEWFVGFADGEGCFTIRAERALNGVNAGQRKAQVRFEINQAIRDAAIIEQLQAFFGFGRVDRQPGRRSPICQWRVLRQSDLEELVAVFDRTPLRTIKRHDYAIWRRAVIAKGRFHRGPASHNGTNEQIWAELDGLAAELRAVREGRRSALALT
jgi:hypothetical protein